MKLHDLKKNPKLTNGNFLRIDRLYAFISTGERGEGVIAMHLPNGQVFPLIGADLERVEQCKPYADRLTQETGVSYEIRLFERVSTP